MGQRCRQPPVPPGQTSHQTTAGGKPAEKGNGEDADSASGEEGAGKNAGHIGVYADKEGREPYPPEGEAKTAAGKHNRKYRPANSRQTPSKCGDACVSAHSPVPLSAGGVPSAHVDPAASGSNNKRASTLA